MAKIKCPRCEGKGVVEADLSDKLTLASLLEPFIDGVAAKLAEMSGDEATDTDAPSPVRRLPALEIQEAFPEVVERLHKG